MIRTSRTFRLPVELSLKLDSICQRHGDATWHTEQAFTAYLADFAPHSDNAPVKPKAVAKPAKRFTKPSLVELQQQFHDKGSKTCNDDAQAFTDHYESNGWKVGKNPMKNWKSAVNNWIRGNSNARNKPNTTEGPTKRDIARDRHREDVAAITAMGSGSRSENIGAVLGNEGCVREQVGHTVGSND